MTALTQPLRQAGKLVLTLSLIALSAAAINKGNATAIQDPQKVQEPQNPHTIALKSWHGYLEQIGWPKEMRERIAPRFLGKLSKSVANEHGGQTITFDGSGPGLLATVTLVLGADGKPVVKPVVELADVVRS